MRRLARAAGACLALACGEPGPVGCEAGPPPDDVPAAAHNLLIVLLDDIGVDKVSAYGLHPDAPPTPTLDGLASAGVRFDRAYAEPSCSPSRAALLTGRHPTRTGVGQWLDPRADAWSLADHEITMAEALAPTGRATAFIGKWHLSSFQDPDARLHPNQQGFVPFRGLLGNPQMATGNDGRSRDYHHWERVDDGVVSWSDTWLTTAQIDDALGVATTAQEPWAMVLALSAAHQPWSTPPGQEPATGSADRYDAVVRDADAQLGRLLDGMGAIRDRTLVMVIGDNGTPDTVTRPPWNPERAKDTLWEGGVRVPLLVAGPGVDAPGRTSQALVHIADVFATALDLADAPPPTRADGAPVPVDGRSFASLLTRADAPAPRACLMVEAFQVPGDPDAGWRERAVIGADTKLWRDIEGVTHPGVVGPDPTTEAFTDAEDADLRRALRAYERGLRR